ncbi:MAG: hypothetical protein JSR15_05155 [Proteobacteria bacterium]|nr:hypothetical protein [Pseudomonadota bacterium]
MAASDQGTRHPPGAATAATPGAADEDARFLAALEDCSLPPERFDHAAHVRAGYLYLRQASFPQATASMCSAIDRYARALGKPERYHETITVAFMALINQRLRAGPHCDSWADFRAHHPQLMLRDALLAYYPRAVLESPAARRCFTLPPLPA